MQLSLHEWRPKLRNEKKDFQLASLVADWEFDRRMTARAERGITRNVGGGWFLTPKPQPPLANVDGPKGRLTCLKT